MTSDVFVNTKSNGSTWRDSAGLAVLPIRLVVGWTYFSAFWRRVALENKLDPDVSGYVGEKFNHFLPQALGIKPIIAFLVEHGQVQGRGVRRRRVILRCDGSGSQGCGG
ncbi:TQO small subunit DoxD, partial [Mycobacteroides abscessus]